MSLLILDGEALDGEGKQLYIGDMVAIYSYSSMDGYSPDPEKDKRPWGRIGIGKVLEINNQNNVIVFTHFDGKEPFTSTWGGDNLLRLDDIGPEEKNAVEPPHFRDAEIKEVVYAGRLPRYTFRKFFQWVRNVSQPLIRKHEDRSRVRS